MTTDNKQCNDDNPWTPNEKWFHFETTTDAGERMTHNKTISKPYSKLNLVRWKKTAIMWLWNYKQEVRGHYLLCIQSPATQSCSLFLTAPLSFTLSVSLSLSLSLSHHACTNTHSHSHTHSHVHVYTHWTNKPSSLCTLLCSIDILLSRHASRTEKYKQLHKLWNTWKQLHKHATTHNSCMDTRMHKRAA